jgi:hypothetical protein
MIHTFLFSLFSCHTKGLFGSTHERGGEERILIEGRGREVRRGKYFH